jgi:hypothetical protein
MMVATAGETWEPGDEEAEAGSASRWRTGLLIVALPLFGQTFHYMKDLPPLWALSKALPLISLPLAYPLLLRGRLPLTFEWLMAFLWLVIVSSTIGIFTFNQNFLIGVTAQIKLLPMLYCLSFLGLLLIVRPTIEELQRAFLWCGGLTFGALVLLWAFAPQSWYAGHYEIGDAPLLSVDDRGNRIRMPMYLGMISFFGLYRRFFKQPSVTGGLLVAVALAVLVGIVKTRAVVLATGVTLICSSFMAASPRWRIVSLLVSLLAALALLQVPYVSSAFDTSSASGFDIRATTISKASAFLGSSPWRWLFGVGTISSIDPDGLAHFFNHFFFLADIAWLGVVFEFGLIGAGMFFALMLSTLLFAARLRKYVDGTFLAGAQDYVLFTILISSLYSTMTLQPGEIAVIAACCVYCWQIVRQEGAVIGVPK